MILIDDIIVDNINIKFYEGIDFDLLLNHDKDGSDGFIFCFIESWINEVSSYNRNRKLTSLIGDVNYKHFEWEEINNNYISVYQTNGMDKHRFYDTIRSNVELALKPWRPVCGITTGLIKKLNK